MNSRLSTLLRSKKGSADSQSGFESSSSALYWVLMLFPIVIILVFFVLLFGGYIDSLSPVPEELPRDLALARISSTCFTYTDPGTQKPQPNIINDASFNQSSLDACFASEPQPSLTVTLNHLKSSSDMENKRLHLGGGASQNIYKRYCLVYNGSHFSPAFLEVAFHE
ncbi:MAG: hypothetical protein ACLFNM_00170 [Candidatus Woesearchaeota archaeon]